MPVPTLAQLVADVEAGPPTCWPALRSLGELGEPEAIAYLAALFAHADPTVRQTAVISLGANPTNTAAVPLLTPLVNDEDHLVRHHARIALHRLRTTPWTRAELDALVAAALEAHRAWWNDLVAHEDTVALVTLHDLGKGVPLLDPATVQHIVDAASAMLRHDDPVARVFGVRVLRELRECTDPAPAFLELLRREVDPDVISWCIGGLGFQGTPAALELLATFVHHQSADLRYRLAAALSVCALPKMTDVARDALLVLSNDANDDVRYSALYELSSWWQHQRLRDPLVRQRLLSGQSDEDEGIRSTCAEAFEAEGAAARDPA